MRVDRLGARRLVDADRAEPAALLEHVAADPADVVGHPLASAVERAAAARARPAERQPSRRRITYRSIRTSLWVVEPDDPILGGVRQRSVTATVKEPSTRTGYALTMLRLRLDRRDRR